MNLKKLVGIALFCILAITTAGCGQKALTGPDDRYPAAPGKSKDMENLDYQLTMPAKGDTVAIMKTNYGDIHIRFFPDDAPKAVENFLQHAKDGYYDGLTFHRVMQDFMIQGGDPEGNGTGGESIWGSAFEDEFSLRLYNYRGALSMANSGANTNGSQFFIVQATSVSESLMSQMKQAGFPEGAIKNYGVTGGTPWLDQVHTVFGMVYSGMDIVDKIAAVETNGDDKPLEDVIINSIEVTTYSE